MVVDKNRITTGLFILFLILTTFYLKLDFYFFIFLNFLIFVELKISKFINFLQLTLLIFLFILLQVLSYFLIFSNIFLIVLFFVFLINLFFYDKYLKLCFSFLIILFSFVFLEILKTDRNLFYMIIFISFINDTFAYIFGNFLKGPLISPRISPKKTWSGTIVSFSISTIILLNLNFSIILSVLFSISLFYGDLFFSYIKRKFNIKDFSSILLSHGGILDRLDSMFFITFLLYFKISFF